MLEGPPAGRGRGLEEGDYQEVESEEGGGGEGEYHVLGEIGGETKSRQPATEYSSLQHK